MERAREIMLDESTISVRNEESAMGDNADYRCYVPVRDCIHNRDKDADWGDYISENIEEIWSQFKEALTYDAEVRDGQDEWVEHLMEEDDLGNNV